MRLMTPQSGNTLKPGQQTAMFGVHAQACSPPNTERLGVNWFSGLRAFLEVGRWMLEVSPPAYSTIQRFNNSTARRAHRLFTAALALTLLPISATAADLRVGLVLDRGGKDDKSFNSSAYMGAIEAKAKLGAFVKYVEAADDNAFEPMLRSFAQKEFDLIIGIGFAQKEAIGKIAQQFPKRHFAIVDAQVDAPNV